MNVISTFSKLGPVDFPEFRNEQFYMVPFTRESGLPSFMIDRWQSVANQMLDGVDIGIRETMYIMVHEKTTTAGSSSRRSGAHIDGYWAGSSWKGEPDWRGVEYYAKPFLGHRGPGPHVGSLDLEPESLVLASNIQGCVVYEGEFELKSDFNKGDCSYVDTNLMKKVWLEPNTAYSGHVMTMLHESMPLDHDADRTVVRINVPGWVN